MIEIKDQERDYTKPVLLVKVIFSILMLLVVFLVFFYFNSRKEQVVNSVPQEDVDQMTTEEQIQALNRRSKTVVPIVKSKKEISSKDLPLKVITMIGPSVTYKVVESIVYDTGENGYEIDFMYPEPVREAYFAFLNSFKSEKWNVLYGSRYEDSGMFDVEKDEFTARLTLSKFDMDNVTVKALIINKK